MLINLGNWYITELRMTQSITLLTLWVANPWIVSINWVSLNEFTAVPLFNTVNSSSITIFNSVALKAASGSSSPKENPPYLDKSRTQNRDEVYMNIDVGVWKYMIELKMH